MDKYEYQVCADQIKALVREKRVVEAMEIADKIDWRRVKSVSMLKEVSEVYMANRRYEEGRDILLLAYDRYPEGKSIIYKLCEVSIKLNDVVSAVEYYKQYMRIAPDDTSSYILLYKIYEAQDVTLEERIQVLEEYKKRNYEERWAYELAYLYHKTGQQSKCIAECDELILWFGEGKYVRKAMELKMEHTDLTPEQRRKYEGRPDPQIVEAYGQPIQTPYDPYAQQQQYQPEQQDYQPQQGYASQELYSQEPYTPPQYVQPDYGENIQVQPVNAGKYSTMNLQEELARSMEAFMANENSTEQGTYYGQTSQLYEPAQNTGPYANVYGNDYENSFSVQNNISRQMYEQGVYEPVISSEPAQMPQEAYAAPPQESVKPKEISVISTGKKYESILKQEYDGQISMSLPDTEMVERQITGQLNLDDILNGFEDRKREAEQKQEEERRLERQRRREEQQKAMNQTGDIMSQLAGVIPGTTGGVLPSGRMLTLEEEYGGNLSKIREEDAKALEAAAQADQKIDGPVPEPAAEPVTAEPEPAAEPATEQQPEAEAAEQIVEQTIEQPAETAAAEPVAAEPEPVAEPATEQQPEVKIAEQTIEQTIEQPVEQPVEPVAEPVAEEPVATEPEAAAEPEPVAEPVTEQQPAFETAERPVEQPIEQPMEQTVEPAAEPAAEIPVEQPVMQEEPVMQEMPAMQGYAADPMGMFAAEDYGEVEEIEDIEQPDDIDDMIKTSNMPIADIERLAQAKYESGIETEDEEPHRRNHPSYMTLEEAVHSRREFNEDEKKIFVRFEGIEALKAQIVDAMDTLSMEAHHGNVIVTGADNSGRKTLALDIVKAIQLRDQQFSGKVAKISGEALNKKNIPLTIRKLHNGALIVENAGGLTIESVNIITDALRQETEPVLVVLEGALETMHPVLHGSRYMPEVFNARIDIAPYTNDDLVAYGKGYAREQEYSIDEMGMLALYTRIGEMQSLDHQVSIEEVREIVDAAIRHVDRKNMSHFMDVLLAKRYDDDDYIILREKDFTV